MLCHAICYAMAIIPRLRLCCQLRAYAAAFRRCRAADGASLTPLLFAAGFAPPRRLLFLLPPCLRYIAAAALRCLLLIFAAYISLMSIRHILRGTYSTITSRR